jgi:hypothetical protein
LNKKRSHSETIYDASSYTTEDKILTLRALRKFGFDAIDAYNVIKKYALNNYLHQNNIKFK